MARVQWTGAQQGEDMVRLHLPDGRVEIHEPEVEVDPQTEAMLDREAASMRQRVDKMLRASGAPGLEQEEPQAEGRARTTASRRGPR
jgi:hypothetical protein